MKRMYVTLAVILLVCVWAVSALSQMTTSSDNKEPQQQSREPFDRMKRRMELRAEMHRRMMEKLLHGNGPDHDIFKDMEQAFEESMKDSFADFGSISPSFASSPHFKSEWKETKEGRILEITPQSKDQKLNIDVSDVAITISGESQQKTATSSYTSKFSNSFSVPDDCDGSKVKMNSTPDGKILVELPYKSTRKVDLPKKTITPPKEDRKPIQGVEGDVEI